MNLERNTDGIGEIVDTIEREAAFDDLPVTNIYSNLVPALNEIDEEPDSDTNYTHVERDWFLKDEDAENPFAVLEAVQVATERAFEREVAELHALVKSEYAKDQEITLDDSWFYLKRR